MAFRRILANPGEPDAGIGLMDFYNRTHPNLGTLRARRYFRDQFSGFFNRTNPRPVVVGTRILRVNVRTGTRQWQAMESRPFILRNYRDLFGPGSVLARIIHSAMARGTKEQLFIFALDIRTV